MSEPEMVWRVRSAILVAMRAHGESEYVDETTGRACNLTSIDGDFDLAAIARAAIEAMRDLPEQPGPLYAEGYYNRGNVRAFVADALAEPTATR